MTTSVLMEIVSAALTKQRRDGIARLEDALRKMPGAVGPEAFTTRHHFAPGAYAREIEVPAGTLVVGKIHRHAHVNVISKGRVMVATPGADVEELEAPVTFISQPGTKRAVLALTDTVWTTVHVTESTDLAEIERQVIAPSFDALEGPQ